MPHLPAVAWHMPHENTTPAREATPDTRLTRRACRVCRRKLRAELLRKCARAGVKFLAGEVVEVDAQLSSDSVRLTLDSGKVLRSRCCS